jgi:hypothetical protein
MNINRILVFSVLTLSNMYGATPAPAARAAYLFRFPTSPFEFERCLKNSGTSDWRGERAHMMLAFAAQHFAGKEATQEQLNKYAKEEAVSVIPFTDEGVQEELVGRLTVCATRTRE